MADESAQRVIAHYRLVRVLGSGGMGTVYEGRDRRDESRVAVKFLRPELASGDGSFRERFEREAHVAALLRSPYTVKLIDYGIEDGQPYLVMDFAEGEPLSAMLGRGPLSPARATKIARDVARALEEAEARGVVHRDIKPENIIVGTGDAVKVADFGVSRQFGDAGITIPGGFVGTAAYAAPEQFSGRSDNRSDIYALGATLFTMLVGRPPAGLGTLARPDASARLEGQLARIVRRCLEPNPVERYQSSRELAGDLSHALDALSRSLVPEPEEAGPAATVVATPQRPSPPPPPPAARPGGTAAQPPSQPSPAYGGGTGVATPRLALSAKGSAGGRASYELAIENPGSRAIELHLSAGAGPVLLTMPSRAVVAAGGVGRVEVMAEGSAKRRFGGTRRLPFTIEARPTGGGPPVGTVSGDFVDEPDPRGRMFAIVGGVVVGALALVGVLFAAGAFGGGDDPSAASDDDDDDRTSTRTATSRATATPTEEETEEPTETPTAEETPTEEATPTEPVAPADSIVAGRWNYPLEVVSNSCGGDPVVGTLFDYSYDYDELGAEPDGYVSVGEEVQVTQVYATGTTIIGTAIFGYPRFTFEYPINGGRATLENTFASANSGFASLTESYDVGNDTCSLLMRDVAPAE